ncbi:hypothetical protein TSAR_008686 [Trichomalopsis sarcophagae]|uniref:Uncharacterized protein n=1 Tax=Trichomalopsis sarcophagae TaxID=543379 RepID=A0A232EVV7_9HYME|nr:hypothetical protein TSAR_008686 [Trichomalopsis sarcophagae]
MHSTSDKIGQNDFLNCSLGIVLYIQFFLFIISGAIFPATLQLPAGIQPERRHELIVHCDTCDLNGSFYTAQLAPERSEGAKCRLKLNHLCQKYPQTAKIRKSRLFVTKVILTCTVRLAHERSECDKHGTKKDYFSHS